MNTKHRESNAQQYYNKQRRDSEDSGDKVSVYQYKGNEAYQIDDFDDDYNHEGNGRDRQVSYYVNKDIGKQISALEDDDDDYGAQVFTSKGSANMANHRDTYRRGSY